MGGADEKLDPRGSGTEVRMHDGDEVGLVLLAREEGMTLREAAELAGVTLSTAGCV